MLNDLGVLPTRSLISLFKHRKVQLPFSLSQDDETSARVQAWAGTDELIQKGDEYLLI